MSPIKVGSKTSRGKVGSNGDELPRIKKNVMHVRVRHAQLQHADSVTDDGDRRHYRRATMTYARRVTY